MDVGDDDMCRTSSAVATPESSYATVRAAPLSVSHRSESSGHSSRKGHLPPMYTTSPVVPHHRYDCLTLPATLAADCGANGFAIPPCDLGRVLHF